MILGIDPGTTHSGYAYISQQYDVLDAGKVENVELLRVVGQLFPSAVVIESLQSFGQAVGREVFETAYWIGEIRHACRVSNIRCYLFPRPEYGRAFCGVQKVNDSVLRQSLLLRFGGDKKGEPLALLRGETDKRSAFAVAAYFLDKQNLNHSFVLA